MTAPQPLLTVNEVAERLHVSRATVYNLMRSDPAFPPCLRFNGGPMRFRLSTVERYIETCEAGEATRQRKTRQVAQRLLWGVKASSKRAG